ncbi:hypothetical protein BpHYR1_020129 [Brachionus plicatilis]|uniref:Uncharacterized protein n=1 Tax=Brachionus plicatilis TaxID=10195 RepID=A0A3M7RY97_BRAPC|nr:hypothetical protein BpHYR1_020129 [Brachionus plicatilis]
MIDLLEKIAKHGNNGSLLAYTYNLNSKKKKLLFSPSIIEWISCYVFDSKEKILMENGRSVASLKM